MQETTPSASTCSAAASVASIFAPPTARSSVKEKLPICLSASLVSLASSSADVLDRCWSSCASVLRPRSPRRYVAAAVSADRTPSSAWQSAVVLAEAGRATSSAASRVKGTAIIVNVFMVLLLGLSCISPSYAAWFISAGCCTGASVPAGNGRRFSSKFQFQSWYTGG